MRRCAAEIADQHSRPIDGGRGAAAFDRDHGVGREVAAAQDELNRVVVSLGDSAAIGLQQSQLNAARVALSPIVAQQRASVSRHHNRRQDGEQGNCGQNLEQREAALARMTNDQGPMQGASNQVHLIRRQEALVIEHWSFRPA